VLLIASWSEPPWPLARTRHRDRLARALGEQVLREAPPHAIVITLTDAIAGALFYLQEAERKRPDIVVLAYGLAASSWHWSRIYQSHAELTEVALRGPGGKAGRVQRFLAAHHARPLVIESAQLAERIGVAACPGGLYLRAGPLCAPAERATAANLEGVAATLLATQLRELGDGSPSADEAIAQTAFTLGESLWRLDAPAAAYDALLAGVPREHQPALRVDPAALHAAQPLRGHMPRFRLGVALGDPARNLWLAAMLCKAAGQHAVAAELLRNAAALDLPEALAIVR
jgi:hypothetical protein